MKDKFWGILICFLLAVPSWILGQQFPIIGGAVIAILAGMVITMFWQDKGKAGTGINWTSKFILQAAVVFLGFGMNLSIVIRTGFESLPIIISTIAISLIIAWVLHKTMNISKNAATLVGVGSSICGGSAIAAAAPVINADNDEVAQSVSVIFFFNVLAALFFPILGTLVGFDTTSGYAFGIFAGTAINDTSSVTAAAATWDSMFGLWSATLDQDVTVKLTRALAIIPITLGLAILVARSEKKADGQNNFSLKRAFPMFILYFVLASVFTTVCLNFGVSVETFQPLKELAKFFIIMAMGAIGLNSNLPKLIKTGGRPLLLGLCCWVGITLVSLAMQHIMGIW